MIYFGHCIKDYDTEIEKKAVEALQALGEVENPNQPHHSENYKLRRMKYYTHEVIPRCEAMAYLPIEGNRITSGVVLEIKTAIGLGKVVYRIDRDTLEVAPLTSWIDRPLSYDETIEFLNEG